MLEKTDGADVEAMIAQGEHPAVSDLPVPQPDRVVRKVGYVHAHLNRAGQEIGLPGRRQVCTCGSGAIQDPVVVSRRDRGIGDGGTVEERPDQAGLIDEIQFSRDLSSFEIDPCDSVCDVRFRVYPGALHPPEKVRAHAPGAGVNAAGRRPVRHLVHVRGASEIRQCPVEPGPCDPCAGDGDSLRDLLRHGAPPSTFRVVPAGVLPVVEDLRDRPCEDGERGSGHAEYSLYPVQVREDRRGVPDAAARHRSSILRPDPGMRLRITPGPVVCTERHDRLHHRLLERMVIVLIFRGERRLSRSQ